VNLDYAAKVSAILEKRCEILRKYGLKGVWNATNPAVMPDTFFTAHPELRGPRIDRQSLAQGALRTERGRAEMLRIYRESHAAPAQAPARTWSLSTGTLMPVRLRLAPSLYPDRIQSESRGKRFRLPDAHRRQRRRPCDATISIRLELVHARCEVRLARAIGLIDPWTAQFWMRCEK